MPKIPYKSEKSQEDNEDYEIVSFEEFCDKSGGSKADLLTLNDNINYLLSYESDKLRKVTVKYDEAGSSNAAQTETSLSGVNDVTTKKKTSGSFAPFGRYNGKPHRGPLFGGVIPKPRPDGDPGSGREPRYQRFSGRRSLWQRACDKVPGAGSGMLGIALVCALCVAAWWAVCGSLGGAWQEDHYRKLWERAHPDNIKKPLTTTPFEKVIPEYRYHDHNNLSTKNKNTVIDYRKKEYKKSYDEMSPEQFHDYCAGVQDNMRFDCSPNGNQSVCEERGCCWKEPKDEDDMGIPYCFYPPEYRMFEFVNMTENKHGVRALYAGARRSGYPGDFKYAVFDFQYLDDNTIQIKIYDPENKRFEVPMPQLPLVPGPISSPKLRIQIDTPTLGFKVIRNADNVTILNTQDVGGLILSDKFLQISAILPTDRIFGFGEHMDSLRRNMEWKTYTIYNTDGTPRRNLNLYGTQPFYMGVEKDGKTHGMLFLNSNAMDVVLQPTPAVTYRTIGGILRFVVFAGPTPAETVSQYTAMVGRPFMPPYWSLGFHLCKYGYHTLNETRRVWKSNREAGLPFDVQWNDIDYMKNQNDFTYDPVRFAGLSTFVKEIHSVGMHYVMLFDPGVGASEKPGTYPPYDRGIEMDIFIKNRTNHPYVGHVWNPKSTVFPDFTHPDAQSYWLEMMTNFHNKIAYDGAWIDMNEISNFDDGPDQGTCLPENLPYRPLGIPDSGLQSRTLCPDAKHHLGLHYDVHNLYSLYEAIATNFALKEIRGKRPFIISRASFPGLGRYAGHWSGDILANWQYMRATIPEILSFSLFGIPMVGADICGFAYGTTVQLCKRWMQLGAFYPFSRNHADLHAHGYFQPQDPVSMGSEVLKASVAALRLRYQLLPYYYTLFWRAHTEGATVATPLFFLSPENQQLQDIEDQFLIGEYVMITPILDEDKNTTKAFYPGPHKWYNIRNGYYLASDAYKEITDHEMVAVRSGAVLPLQEPPMLGPITTTKCRSKPLQLLAVPDKDNSASGTLYWDDGDSLNSYEEKKFSKINFKLKDQELSSTVEWWGYGVPTIDMIIIFAQTKLVENVTLNGSKAPFQHDPKTQTLTAYSLNLSLEKPFNLKWTYKPLVVKQARNDVNSRRSQRKHTFIRGSDYD